MCDTPTNHSLVEKPILGINPSSFYGCSVQNEFPDSGKTIFLPESSLKFRNLFAPSTLWKTFNKQQQVLEYVSVTNCDLFPFTYQTETGHRLFLAAHPITFWFIDEQRPLNKRHSYEIIREFKPCKLYFDLEFELIANPGKDGHLMVKIFISLVCHAVKQAFDITCIASDLLDLDSSSNTKFSCHLIFTNIIFENNYEVGYFVKQLCNELKMPLENEKIRLLRNVKADNSTIQTLFVSNGKGQRVLFCDEAVYTKNRHFRLYKSSKHGKNIPLIVSERNAFPIKGNDSASREEFIFLNSLVTHCPHPPSNLLKFETDSELIQNLRSKIPRPNKNMYPPSTFSDIDEYIKNIVTPGHIYKSTYFPEKKIIVYDIIGNRYCENIGRQHKSNNVKFIVDMNKLIYYQKCYDPDCSDFQSEKRKLAISEDILWKYNFDDESVLAVAEQCEMNANLNSVPFSFIGDDNSNIVSRVNETDRIIEEMDNHSVDELLVEVTEQCELSACMTDSWDLVIS